MKNFKVYFISAKEFVLRTCSSNPKIEIEFNLIDLICLREWKTSGRLCFCEHDRCNNAHSVNCDLNFVLILFLIANICNKIM